VRYSTAQVGRNVSREFSGVGDQSRLRFERRALRSSEEICGQRAIRLSAFFLRDVGIIFYDRGRQRREYSAVERSCVEEDLTRAAGNLTESEQDGKRRAAPTVED